MKHIKLYEDFINEATTSWKKMMQGVRSSETGPWSIVAIENKKVVGQKIDIRIQDMIPAYYEAMRKEFPRAKIHIEDGTGMVVWNESLELDESLVNEDSSTAFLILMNAAIINGLLIGQMAASGSGGDGFTPIKDLKAWWQKRKSDKALKSIIDKIKDDEDVIKFMKLTPSQQRGKFRSLIATKLTDDELEYLNKINRSHFQTESLIFENISNISDYKPLNTTLDSVRIKDIAKRDKDAVFIIKKEYFGNRFQDDVLAKYDSSYRSITSFAPIGKEKDLKNKDVLSKSELENLSDEIINDKYFQGTIDVLKGNISKFVRLAELNEGNLGVSLKSLPEKIKRKMDYEYDSNTPEYDLAINMLQKYLKNNLTKLENGKSIHSISNKGKDLEEIADLLETTPIDIIEYIDMTIDNIVK
jgi:hypothetical protein